MTNDQQQSSSSSFLEEKQLWANRRNTARSKNNNSTTVPGAIHSSPDHDGTTTSSSILEEKQSWENRKRRNTNTSKNDSSNMTTTTTPGATAGTGSSSILNSKERISNRGVTRNIRATSDGTSQIIQKQTTPEVTTTTTTQEEDKKKEVLGEVSENARGVPENYELHQEDLQPSVLIQAQLVSNRDNNNEKDAKEQREWLEAEIRDQVQREAVQAEVVVPKTPRRRRKILLYIVLGIVVVVAFACGILLGVTQAAQIQQVIPWQDVCEAAPLKEGPNITVMFGRLNFTVDDRVEPCFNTTYYQNHADDPTNSNSHAPYGPDFLHRGIWAQVQGTGETMTLSYASTNNTAGVYVYQGTNCSVLTCVDTLTGWPSTVEDNFYLYAFVPDDVGTYTGNATIVIQ